MAFVSLKLNKQAYDEIKERIIGRIYPPGTRLIDTQLAEEFGISRTPVRDSIIRLKEEGLVSYIPSKGYCVFEPSATDIEDLYEVRMMLDIFAVTKLINEILPQRPYLNSEISAICTTLLSAESEETFIQSDESFHDCIISMCGNSKLSQMYADIRNQMRVFRRQTSRNFERREKARMYHEKIYRGLMTLDLTMTISAVKEHTISSRADALSDFV